MKRALKRALKIHETAASDGTLLETFLVAGEDGALGIVCGEDATRDLPSGALEAVMKRYGSELDAREKLVEVGELALEDGQRLRHVRHLGFYDVIARDYLVLETADGVKVFAMAITVAGALEHLAKRATAAGSSGG
jgi:hypothetical protein